MAKQRLFPILAQSISTRN
ncbi:hypothetical protein Pint_02223 [Pistacia integerrima]|uniref:Uncharacterized protein n=1 Tax=Pistacia integerrima TaxID=434235 RepID=A0ACC0ZKE8_9ROSI|nr:hypothetical protein Pint_02223 [Pistacia integerrima]